MYDFQIQRRPRMESTDVISLVVLLCLVWLAVNWWWQRRSARQTAGWSLSEATIESVKDEIVNHSGRGGTITLPVLAFSYQVSGEYYSGRFALYPYITDLGDMTRMIGRKLQVRYNPAHPEMWFIPDKLMEGCKVEQKMDPHLINLYPDD